MKRYMYVRDIKQPKKSIAQRKYKDDRTYSMYRCFVQQRNQALYRKESWSITFEEWKAKWDSHFEQRGRTHDAYCSTRIDPEKPWDDENFAVRTRYDVMSNHAYNVNSKKIKKIRYRYIYVTNLGEFPTRKAAALAYNLSEWQMRQLEKKNPDKLYFKKVVR